MPKQPAPTKALAGGLTVACLMAALACQPGEAPNAGSEDATAAEHPEDAGGQVHWAYEGETGTDRWGELDPAFEACATGM